MPVIVYPKLDTRTAILMLALLERLGSLLARQPSSNETSVGEATDIRDDARKLIKHLDEERKRAEEQQS